MRREEHLLQCLQEEAAELIQAASKINRFGLRDFNPETGENNEDKFIAEAHDLIAVLQMVNDEFHLGIGETWKSELAIEDKKKKVNKYIEYARERGAVDADS